MIKDWPWQPHPNLDFYPDSRDRITTGHANTNDKNDPNQQKTEDKTQDILQDKEDNSKKKQKQRQTNCPRMKTKYKILSNTNDNRKITTLKTLIFPKKLLILICFLFFLPSTLPRCITLPENVITAKGRKARVRFSSTDCSIQKINVPLRLQEKSAGLIPLKFKVYEYGTKPEEYTTSTQPTLPAISNPLTSKPELEGSEEPGKGPLPELDITTGVANNNPDITTEATSNNPDITTEATSNDLDITTEAPSNDQANGNFPDITTGTFSNDPGPVPGNGQNINSEAAGNEPDITTEAAGNNPEQTTQEAGNDLDIFTEPVGNGPDITSEEAGNDQDIPIEATGNNPDITTEAPNNNPDISTEAAGNDPDTSTEAAGNGTDISSEAPNNDQDIPTEAGNNPDITTGAVGNDPDISTEAAGNNPDITTGTAGNDPDLDPEPGNDPEITTDASGNNPDMTTGAVSNALVKTTESAGNGPYTTTEAVNNDLSSFQVENIISYVTEVELPSGESFDEEDGIEDGIEHDSNGPDDAATPDNAGGSFESNSQPTNADVEEEGGVTPQSDGSQNGHSDEAIFASIQSAHIAGSTADGILEMGTTSQLGGHSGEVGDHPHGAELGNTTPDVTGTDDTLQSEVADGGAEEHGGGTEATSSQSVVTEDIPPHSDEEEGDSTQPNTVNEGVSSPDELLINAGTSAQSAEVSSQPDGTLEETSIKEEGTGIQMPTQSVTNQLTGDNVEQPEASLQVSGSTEQSQESGTTAMSTGNPEPGTTDVNAGATTQPVEDLGTTEDGNDVMGEEGATVRPDNLEEESTTTGQSGEEDRSSTRQSPSHTTTLSSGIQEEEEETTEEDSESEENLMTTLKGDGTTELEEDPNNNETPTQHADSTQEEVFSVTDSPEEPEEATINSEESSTGQHIVEEANTVGISIDTNDTNGGFSEQSIDGTDGESTEQPDATEEVGNADPVSGLADTEDAVVDVNIANDQDSVEITTTLGIHFETEVNAAKTSTTNEMSTNNEEALTTIKAALDSTESSMHATFADPTFASQPNLSAGDIDNSSGSTATHLEATSATEEIDTSSTSAIESTLGVNETPLQNNTFSPSSSNIETTFLDSSGETTVSNQPSDEEASVTEHISTSSEADIVGATEAFSSSAAEEGPTSADSLPQMNAGKSETSSPPSILTNGGSASALLGADTASQGTSPQSSTKGTTSQNIAETSPDSLEATTQVSREQGSSVAGADVGTASMYGSDLSSLPNLPNAGTEPANPSQAMATTSGAEVSSSGLEEAEVVINLKTVGSNIISSTIDIDDGGNDLTTRQFTLFTGSTKDNMTPDQTRQNNLQDLTTKTHDYMTSTMDILTQDSTQTNKEDKQTVRIQTTTDNSVSEGQAPELNPSSPDSQTNVNTNSNNLAGTKNPLSTQLEGQTTPFAIEENESNSEETSKEPTKPTWTDTTLDSGITIESIGDANQPTPEPDMELNINLAQDLTPESVSSTSTTPCICPTTTTSFGTTGSTTTGTTTASGDCLCPDIILGPAEVETATDLPVTSGGRRRREWDDDDLYVDDFDQKILKKMPFLKFY